ncbi:hypothetical protein Btru_048486 [Bulinus truncatus]|nr:hypothetical protein Btru_048486 [Bulinus truncatus]
MAYKFVIGHHLKTLLNDVEEKQKKDISDFAKGHLNESRLLQGQLLINRKSWQSSNMTQNRVKKSTRNKQLKTDLHKPKALEKDSVEIDALLDFTLGTSGAIPNLPSKVSSTPDVRYRLVPISEVTNVEKKAERSKSPHSLYSQIDDGTLIEELPLHEVQMPTFLAPKMNLAQCKKPSLSAPTDDALNTTLNTTDPFSHSVIEMYSRGMTKTDQYKKMKSFETVVLKKKEMTEQKILSGEKATRHHEQKLEKELSALHLNNTGPNLQKLQVYSSVFEDIIDESPIFSNILHTIKDSYDRHIARLLETDSFQEELLREQVIQMASKGTSLPGEMNAASQQLAVLEEKVKNLMKLNQRLLEDQQHELSKTPELPAKRNPASGYSRKDLPVELSFELENMKALILEKLDELNTLHVKIRDEFVPVTVCTHLEQCIKETEGEVQKLLKQNEYFERSIAEMEAELKEAITEADTSEKDARRIWNKVNSVRDLTGSLKNNSNDEDLDEESKWNWYIS